MALIFSPLLISFCRAEATAPESATARPIYGLARATTIPPMDGNINAMVWTKAEVAEIVTDSDEPSFRGKVRALWDDQCLYVAFDVEDASPMRNSGSDPFLAFKTGDAVDIYIGTNPSADPSRKEPDKNDYRILLTYLGNTKPVAYLYHPTGRSGEPKYFVTPSGGWRTRMDEHVAVDGVKMALKRRPNNSGYVLEAAIPWSALGGFIPKPGLRLPFDLAITFSDSTGNANVAKTWWCGASQLTTDTATELRLNPNIWGWVSLKDGGG